MSETGLHAWRYLSSEADSVADSATPCSNRCTPNEILDSHGMCNSPLPVSQLQIDLESFAASILLDDHAVHLEHPLDMDLTGNSDGLLDFAEHLDGPAACSMQDPALPQQFFPQYSDGTLHRTVETRGSGHPTHHDMGQQARALGYTYTCHTAAPIGAASAAPQCFNTFLLDTAEFQGASMGLADVLEDPARAQLSRTASLPPNPNRHMGHLSFQHSEPCSPGVPCFMCFRKNPRMSCSFDASPPSFSRRMKE
jgi:hypothetical protein